MIKHTGGHSKSTRSQEDLMRELRDDVSKLNPDERETFKLMLEEFQQPSIVKGERIIDVLSDAEYEREPVDMETFIKDEYFLGNTCGSIYPEWLASLKELFGGGYNEAIFCLHPDTPVPLLDGTTKTIQELADRWAADPTPFWVYGVKPDGEMVSALAESPRCTGEDDYYEVELDDGTIFTGNARHRMVLLTGEKRMIRDMSPGDSLMPFATKLSSKSKRNRHVVAIRKVGCGPVFCMTVPATTTFAICTRNVDGTFARSGVYSSNTGAIGTGKTFAASIGATRILYELSCLRDPQKSFGLAPGSTISIANMSVNELLARKVVFENLGSKIKASPYFSENFKPEFTQKEMRFPKNIWLTARATTDHSVLGMNLIASILDECFPDFSEIIMENGCKKTVRELAGGGAFKVRSFDFKKNVSVSAEAYLKPSVTKECLELTFEDGQTFSASWDHPVAVRKEDGVLAFVSMCDILEHQEVITYASQGTEAIRGSQAEDQRGCQETDREGQPVLRKEAHARSQGEDGRSSPEASGVEAHRRDEGEDERSGDGEAEVRGAEAQAVCDDAAVVCGGKDRSTPSPGNVRFGQPDVWKEADTRAEGSHRGCQPGETLDGGELGSRLPSSGQQDRSGQGARADGACSSGHIEGRRHIGEGRPGTSGVGTSGARSGGGSDRVRSADGSVQVQRQEPLDDSRLPSAVCRREPQGHRSEDMAKEGLDTRAAQNRRRSELLREARLGIRGVGRVLSVGRVVSKRSLGLLPTYSICVPGYEVFVADGVLVHNTNFMNKNEGKKTQDGRRYGMIDQAETLYVAMKRRMKSRFERGGKLPGMLFIVSSKQTQDDFTARRIQASLDDPSVLVRDFSLWDVKPKHYSDKRFHVLCGNESIPSRVLDAGEETRYEEENCPENCVLIKVPEDFRSDFESDLEGCLTGDTFIPLLDGTEVPIKDLVGREEFRTYSYTPDGRFQPGRGSDARLTRKNAELVRVTLDNGEVVRCTVNHPFMLRSGEYREASELRPYDSLMPFWHTGPFETCPRCLESLRSDGNNHKVVSVEPAGREDVYDITVAGTHNFALSAGVVVHNSIRDIAGVATVSVNPYIQRRDKIASAMTSTQEHPFSVVVYDPSKGGSFIWDRLVHTTMVRTGAGVREPMFKPLLNPDAPRHVHIDPSLRGDATGFCMSHISGFKEVIRRAEDGRKFAERAPVYTVDIVLQIVPPLGGEIVLGDLRHLVYDLSAHGFMITRISLDSWQCLAAGTRVATSCGLIPIEKVQVGDSVVSREGPARVLNTFAYPETETFRIETTDGEVLEGTGKHRIEAATYYHDRICPESIRKYRTGSFQGEPRWEWVRLDELRVGQAVRMVSPDLGAECLFVDLVPLIGDKDALGFGNGGVPGVLDAWEPPDCLTVELAEWLGLIWGDGDIGKDSIRLTLTEEEYPSACRVFENLFGFYPEFSPHPDRECGLVRLSARWFSRWLHLNGLVKPLIPEAIFRSPAFVQAAFLRGLFATDGWVSTKDGGSYLSSAILDLVGQVQMILRSSFGIESSIMTRSPREGRYADTEEHVLTVRRSRALFAEKVGFSYQWKDDLLRAHGGVPGRRIFTKVARILPGNSKVFDLEVEGDPSYTANGFVSHNSADTIQQMKQRGYRAEVVSVDITPDPYDNLKTALYEDRVVLYDYPPLRKELETLQEDRRGRRRKIDHPPNTGSKDCADALAGCLYTLSQRSMNQPLPMIQHSEYAQDPWMPEQSQAVSAGMLEARVNETLPPILFGATQNESWVTGGGRKQ